MRPIIVFLSFLAAAAYLQPAAAAAADQHTANQIYIDVVPANTTEHLEAIRKLPLSTFRLSYERVDSTRKRVGVIGPELAAIIPDAVEISRRTLPPREKGGAPVVLEDFPSINENILFMHSVGATQELAKMLRNLENEANNQMEEVASLYGEVAQLERVLSSSSDGDAELRMREAAAKAAIAKSEMELEISRAKSEEEYAEEMRRSEEEQLRRSEELTLARLKREDEAAKVQAENALRMKFETSQRVEQARKQSAEAVAAIEHQQKLLLQKAAEEMKVKTAKVSHGIAVALNYFGSSSRNALYERLLQSQKPKLSVQMKMFIFASFRQSQSKDVNATSLQSMQCLLIYPRAWRPQ
jgi:hypothetical protein